MIIKSGHRMVHLQSAGTAQQPHLWYICFGGTRFKSSSSGDSSSSSILNVSDNSCRPVALDAGKKCTGISSSL